MRHWLLWNFLAFSVWLFAQAPTNPEKPRSEEPLNEKAQKTYRQAEEYLNRHMLASALDEFKKADKQDDGHCLGCQKQMIRYGIQFRDWKAAEIGASEILASAEGYKKTAIAHYQYGLVLMYEGMDKHKDEFFTRAHEELTKALATIANFPDAVYVDGRVLANLKQDDAAKAQFQHYVAMTNADPLNRQRALRYVAEPELARARMAPPFSVTTVDGQNISLDDLRGKVVLIDFWATWCGPCREAVPHIRQIATKFQDEPLVILSVNLDQDQQKWKDFIAKNGMTWPQYCDGGFDGPIAQMFNVRAIPHTFTIDADGVLQDEQIGDASIEGKLKKLIARAQELQQKTAK